jgi:hypothetical protein
MNTEVRFIGPEFDGAENELGDLTDKLKTVANNAAYQKYGKNFIPDPTDIEVLPTMTAEIGETTFILRAWHETESVQGVKGIWQRHDTSFSLTVEGEDAFIRTEEEQSHPISTREMLLLMELAGLAVLKTLLSSKPPEENYS